MTISTAIPDEAPFSETVFLNEPSTEDRYRIIYEHMGRIGSERRVGNLLLHLANMARALVAADRCSVWLADWETDTLWTMAAHGVSEIRIPLSTGLVGYAVQNGLDVYIDDAQNDPRFNKEVDRRTGYHTRSILVLPLCGSNGKVLGALQVLNKRTRAGSFTQDDIRHLQMVVASASASIENTLLNEEIDDTQREIIFTMGEVGEVRSRETGNHVKRVAEYSHVLARTMGLPQEEADLIRTASPMHDIGKVEIPDAILKKPGKLDPEEFKVIQGHAETGYQILKKSSRPILQAAAIVAHEHHERWDGRGYPNGLVGEDIHLYGRITAVADVFDALASKRCYKEAWDLDRVWDEFHKERGAHYCPAATDALFAGSEEILRIRDTYQDN